MNYRLRPHPRMPQIYLYRDPVDFRKSFRGLAAIVEQELGHNPFEGSLYAFTNRRRDKIKLLYWEDNGFVLYYKSLAEERFHWPKGEDEVIALNGQQINWLLDGYDLGAMKGHKKLHYEATLATPWPRMPSGPSPWAERTGCSPTPRAGPRPAPPSTA